MPSEAHSPAQTLPLVKADDLAFAHPGFEVFAGLHFNIHPGLTLVRGGDGRGKTTLLHLLAGTLKPQHGVLQRRAHTVFWEHPADAAHDATVARAWLVALEVRHTRWNEAMARSLAAAWALEEHLHKPLFMLSTGSRRKLGLVAAAASGAPLTLLDTPYAALDAPSARVLNQVLAEAASGRERAWVVADGERPAGLAGLTLAGCIDLGD